MWRIRFTPSQPDPQVPPVGSEDATACDYRGQTVLDRPIEITHGTPPFLGVSSPLLHNVGRNFTGPIHNVSRYYVENYV